MNLTFLRFWQLTKLKLQGFLIHAADFYESSLCPISTETHYVRKGRQRVQGLLFVLELYNFIAETHPHHEWNRAPPLGLVLKAIQGQLASEVVKKWRERSKFDLHSKFTIYMSRLTSWHKFFEILVSIFFTDKLLIKTKNFYLLSCYS